MGLVFEDNGRLFLFRFSSRLPFTFIVWPYGYVTLFTAFSVFSRTYWPIELIDLLTETTEEAAIPNRRSHDRCDSDNA